MIIDPSLLNEGSAMKSTHRTPRWTTPGVLASVMVLGLMGAGNAHADHDFIACASLSYDITDKVQYTGSTFTPALGSAEDCDILDPMDGNANDSPQPGFVNDHDFFDTSTLEWVFAGKQNIGGDFDDGTIDIGFTITGDGESGTWTFDLFGIDDVDEVMFVFKEGAVTNLVAYLLTSADGGRLDTSGPNYGTWSTPFVSPPFTLQGSATSTDVSHISAYIRGDDDLLIPSEEVPEPAPLALLGAGLVGLVVARRRRGRRSLA